jgi:hypothetical protein
MPFEAADAWGRKNNRISAFWLFDQQKFTVQAEMVKQRLFLAHDSHQILTLYYFKGRKNMTEIKKAKFLKQQLNTKTSSPAKDLEKRYFSVKKRTFGEKFRKCQFSLRKLQPLHPFGLHLA